MTYSATIDMANRPKPRPTSADITKGERDRHFRLCAAIRDARVEKGWSQEDLAQRLGVGQKYVSLVETGEKKMGGAGPNVFFEGLGMSFVLRCDRVFGFPLGTLAARAGYVQPLGDDGLRGYVRQLIPPSSSVRIAIEALLDAYEREEREKVDQMRRS